MENYSTFTLFFIAIILIANFIYLFRAIKWYSIRKAFPLNGAGPQYENNYLKYGKANICGHSARNKVFSGITRDGIIIKKPPPVSLLMPPILIPWDAIEDVTIVSSIEGGQASKMVQRFSSAEYAKIELKKFKEFLIVIPWQDTYSNNLPRGSTFTGRQATAPQSMGKM